MAAPPTLENKPMQVIHEIAHRYPEVEVGTACHNFAFKARKKSFLFRLLIPKALVKTLPESGPPV